MDQNNTDYRVFHMGKSKSRNVKKLKVGRGSLANDVEEAIAETNEQLGKDHGKLIVPVIVTYKKKKKKKWNALSF